MNFSFGQSEQEKLEIDVLQYARSPKGDAWDDNLVETEIRVSAGGFRCDESRNINIRELNKLFSELSHLYQTLTGAFEFKTSGGQLTLRFSGNGKGRIELRGEVMEENPTGNHLNFILCFDQTQLRQSINNLEKVMAQFPIR